MKMKRIILYNNISLHLELHCYRCFMSIERTNLYSILGLIIYCPFDCKQNVVGAMCYRVRQFLSTTVELIAQNKTNSISDSIAMR